ncbi:hypothetical protein QR680_008098 [Steinernema hermaphroditum]|uniref:Uncharacterized protein n=1 Tax=Steinernema hermaphroditum TaxID=289476 RepID=A0AA39IFC5_9BILA|nr:hypothetical protein QR680_008098 [Steinernema hermaphroditum]
MSFDSLSSAGPSSSGAQGCFPRRALTFTSPDDGLTQIVCVYLNEFNPEKEELCMQIECHKKCTAEELTEKIRDRPEFPGGSSDEYELVEIMGNEEGEVFKERRLEKNDYPVSMQMLWKLLPTASDSSADAVSYNYRFVYRRRKVEELVPLVIGGVRLGGPAEKATSAIESFLNQFLSQPQGKDFPDLTLMPELSEYQLLASLKERFDCNYIYTYIGPILVAVNPFTMFPIYNQTYLQLYDSHGQDCTQKMLPPHIYAIADKAYQEMLNTRKSHCIVISGESGSGKTESANFLLHQLDRVSKKSYLGGRGLEEIIMSAGPVLEAFGNAVTSQNNNSSRFGKFLKLNFQENGICAGASIEIYLLEKSRITFQPSGECNYHVFYYLLCGASEEEKKKHFLLDPTGYKYIKEHMVDHKDNSQNRKNLHNLCSAMTTVGFSTKTQQKMFGLISAVLLLGNINYIKRPGYHSDESAFIENEELVAIIANLLDIKSTHLIQALTMRRTVLKHDTVINRYTLSEAQNTRDAIAKCLYNALFQWIVLKINQALLTRELTTKSPSQFYIGILDIFGFEDVGGEINSFEQLCINYANEHLQVYFNQHIFQFEQQEYINDNIHWQNIDYTDNTACVNLFNSKPYGLLRLIDEECNITNGTDESLLEKMNKFLKGNEYYEIPHKKEPAFIIAHYAGKVKYQNAGFREKNKDLMRHDALAALKNSKSPFVRELVAADPVAVYRWNIMRSVFKAVNAFKKAGQEKHMRRAESDENLLQADSIQTIHSRRSSDSHLSAFLRGDFPESAFPDFCDTSVFKTIRSHARKSPQKGPKQDNLGLKTLRAAKDLVGKKPISSKPQSVSKQFDHSLNRLMKTLHESTPFFIRCIKSNNEKSPNKFDSDLVLRQLRYTGMLETVRIRRAGYSVRFHYSQFATQYRFLLPSGKQSTKEDIKEFLQTHSAWATSIQCGINKIYMREAEKLYFDELLHRTIMKHIVTLQRNFRNYIGRLQYLKMKHIVIQFQALSRGALFRNLSRRKWMAALIIQTHWRRHSAEKSYQDTRKAVTVLQAHCKGYLTRKGFYNNCVEEGTRTPKTPTSPSFKFDQKENVQPESSQQNISTVRTFNLRTFDLNKTMDEYDDEIESDSDDDSDSEYSVGESCGSVCDDDDSVIGDYEAEDTQNDFNDLDAQFVLEDKRLKLIEKKSSIRRQSLAPVASTSKISVKLLRRAASTETEPRERKNSMSSEAKVDVQSISSKSKSKMMGFVMGKHLKFQWNKKAKGIEQEDTLSIPVPSSSVLEMVTKFESTKSAQHNFKITRLHRTETCSLCQKSLTGFLVQGYKCSSCKLIFHKECTNNAQSIPCAPPSSPARSDSIPLRKPWDLKLSPPHFVCPSVLMGTFVLTKTKEQTDPCDKLVETIEDLQDLTAFIIKKQMNLDGDQRQEKRDTIVDVIFKRSLKGLHEELIGYQAVLDEDRTELKYRDLITMFEGLITKASKEEGVYPTFPTNLGVNAFRVFLNEFMQQQQVKKKTTVKRTGAGMLKLQSVRKKRRKSDITVAFNSHKFKQDTVYVPNYCEVCNIFMNTSEKMFLCVNCKMICHKKCHQKAPMCKKTPATVRTRGRFFGSSLAEIIDEKTEVPIVLQKLLTAIELRCLFVEGIYRKSGAVTTVKTVRKQIEEAEDFNDLCFDDVPVHVLTTLVKAFFRELAEPLLSYEFYGNFLAVAEVEDQAERARCLTGMVDMMPKYNNSVLNRLMYHLARVASQESVNRMGSSNLALIFAPCIMRRGFVVHAQDQLQDINKQAICVQTLIEEKLKQYRSTLTQIVEVEQATQKVAENIRRIDEHRRSSATSDDGSKAGNLSAASTSTSNMERSRMIFVEQLDFLDKQKEKLIQELPPLMAPCASSEDLTSEEMNLEVPSRVHHEYAIDFNAPPICGSLPNVYRRARHEVRPPTQRWYRRRWRRILRDARAHGVPEPQPPVQFTLFVDDDGGGADSDGSDES